MKGHVQGSFKVSSLGSPSSKALTFVRGRAECLKVLLQHEFSSDWKTKHGDLMYALSHEKSPSRLTHPSDHLCPLGAYNRVI